jgi:hypothetical protein
LTQTNEKQHVPFFPVIALPIPQKRIRCKLETKVHTQCAVHIEQGEETREKSNGRSKTHVRFAFFRFYVICLLEREKKGKRLCKRRQVDLLASFLQKGFREKREKLKGDGSLEYRLFFIFEEKDE